jgi:hypothetical protein
MAEDWLSHFRKNSMIIGRPDGPGWLTCAEMAEKAKTTGDVMRKYLHRYASIYEKETGSVSKNGRNVKTLYFRPISKVRSTPKAGNRQG